jgi:predicted Zn-dependent peptidase
VATGLLVAVMILSVQAQEKKPDRTKPPRPGAPPSFSTAPVKHDTLSNGIPVLLFEKHDVPIVQINVLVNAGYICDPAGKTGLASMTAAMMMEGAGQRGALELADAVDHLGARLSVAADHHVTGIRLHVPVARLDSALALMGDVLLRPTFPAQELERKKRERLTTLLQWRDEPTALVSVQFDRALYGESHPYGVITQGTEQTIRGMSAEDLRRFHAAWFVANAAKIVVAGDVQPGALHEKLERIFGKWQRGQLPAVTPGPIAQVAGRTIILVDKPGAPQTQIRIGRIGVPRTSADYHALIVMNTLLGGSFTSRLNQNLREKHGYTYGASSHFMFRPLAGPFIAASGVQTAVTDKALTEFMKELTGIRTPVTAEEAERARNYVALGFPSDFQSVAQIAGQLEELAQYGLPDDTFNTFVGKILAVTAADMERVAKATIDPEKIVIVLVGDRAQIEKAVAGLNLGPITNLTIDDVLGKAPVLEGN